MSRLARIVALAALTTTVPVAAANAASAYRLPMAKAKAASARVIDQLASDDDAVDSGVERCGRTDARRTIMCAGWIVTSTMLRDGTEEQTECQYMVSVKLRSATSHAYKVTFAEGDCDTEVVGDPVNPNPDPAPVDDPDMDFDGDI